jgi:hypothetical protein
VFSPKVWVSVNGLGGVDEFVLLEEEAEVVDVEAWLRLGYEVWSMPLGEVTARLRWS